MAEKTRLSAYALHHPPAPMILWIFPEGSIRKMNPNPQINEMIAMFETMMESGPKIDYVLRLFVSGMAPNSLRAIQNLRELCREHLEGRCDLEVIDIYQYPEAGEKEQIIAAPTLIIHSPAPLRKFIGDLSDKNRILVGLDLAPVKATRRSNGNIRRNFPDC